MIGGGARKEDVSIVPIMHEEDDARWQHDETSVFCKLVQTYVIAENFVIVLKSVAISYGIDTILSIKKKTFILHVFCDNNYTILNLNVRFSSNFFQ